MLSRVLLKNRQLVRPAMVRHITSEEIEKYKTDSGALAQWLDVSIVARKGRAFDADRDLISKSKAYKFPMVKASSLNGESVIIPDQIDAKVKLVVFSFKHYGFSLVRSWIDPFIGKFNAPSLPATSSGATAGITDIAAGSKQSNTSGAVAYEICFIEYGFLSMAKSVFAGNIKTNVHPSQVDKTCLAFGGVKVSVLLLTAAARFPYLCMSCTIAQGLEIRY
jgi:hypothetical protein